MPIDTRKAPRRTLSFASIPHVLADLDAIDRAHHADTLHTSGNWTPAQIFNHLTAWIDFAYDGNPPELKFPWILRLLAPLFKKRALTSPFPIGMTIPNVPDGTFGQVDSDFDLALANLRLALERLQIDPPTQPCAFLGHLSHPEWIALHLRHAELHLGFLHLAPPPSPPRP